jgi:signal transduction histidine kinase
VRRFDLSLSMRMIVATAVLALIVAGAFGILVHAVSTLDDATKREAHAKDVTAASVTLEKLVLDLETGLRGFVLTGNERFLQPWSRAREQLPRRLAAFERVATGDRQQARRARDLATLIREYVIDYSEPVVEIARDDPAVARTTVASTEGKRRTDEIREAFGRFLSAEDRLAARSAASARSQSDRAVALAIAGLILSAVLIVGFGLYLARSIARPVRGVATAATRLAAGESPELQKGGPGEVGELTQAFNRMAEQLERGRAELEAQNTKLRESERAKTELVSVVAHELRTPLASVLGFTSFLLSRDVDPDEQKRYLEIIDAQGRRLSSLVDDFLDVQRLEEGKISLAQELVDMAALVREQAQLFVGQSSRHSVDIQLPAKPLPVRGDSHRLAQVVANLLSNAIKYSPEGGVVEIAGERDRDLVRVTVRDEGVGISDDLRERIFNKFVRGGGVARGISGSGLGLTIARSLVEAHGGRIDFKSAIGQGSTFWVELPVAIDGKGS